jgi:hypothetical protein
MICGLAVGLALAAAAGRTRFALAVAFLAILAGFILAELEPAGGSLAPFNWIPFASEIAHPIAGIEGMLETGWPFLGLGAAVYLSQTRRRRPTLFAGGVFVVLVAFLLERMQQMVPGRYGDITVPLIALAAWLLSSLYVLGETESPAMPGEARSANVDS